jgi:hypothetical protein
MVPMFQVVGLNWVHVVLMFQVVGLNSVHVVLMFQVVEKKKSHVALMFQVWSLWFRYFGWTIASCPKVSGLKTEPEPHVPHVLGLGLNQSHMRSIF